MPRFCIALIFVLTSPVLLGQSSLEYSLQPGERYVMHQESEQHITQEFTGMTQEIDNFINGILEFEVAQVVDEHYEMNMKFLDLGMRITSSNFGELMNIKASEVVEGDVQSKIFNSMLDVPIKIILTRSGNVLEVIGGDSLISRMAEASGLEDAQARLALETSLRKEFGSEALSNSFRQMTYIYPDTLSDGGNGWKNEYTGKLSAKNSWSLVKATDSVNHIEGVADIVLNISDPGTSMLLNGTQNTTITVSADTGMILDMTVDGFSEGMATTAATGEMEIPTTVKSTTTYKLIEQ